MAGVRVASFRGIHDLALLPLTRKRDLLAHGLPDRVRRGFPPRQTLSRVTSGTTGANLEVHMSRMELAFRQASLAARMLRDSRFALPIRIVQAGAWIPPELDVEIRTRKFPLGSVVHISRRLPLEAQLHAIERSNPTVLTGCPSNLEILSHEIQRLERSCARPRVAVLRGEVLRPHVRQLVADAFACPVVDYYSAEEIGLIAWECPGSPGHMHVNRDVCVLEIVDDQGVPVHPGDEGVVVVTNLFNATMPLVRYVLDDRTSFLPDRPAGCRCGGDHQTIRTPSGRQDDIVTLADGRRISPRAIDDAIYVATVSLGAQSPFARSVRDYQIVQDAPSRLRILLLTDRAIPDPVAASLREGLRGLHPALEVEVAAVDAIPPDPSGKRRRVIALAA